MRLDEDIRSITYLKAHAAEILTQINETRRPVIVTQNGQARAVLQDPESYQKLHQTLCLLKLVAQGERELREGRTVTQDEVFTNARQHLQKLKTEIAAGESEE
jgi:prevent-host-death family protein